MLVECRDFFIPPLYSTPPLGGRRLNIAIPFCVEKLEWLKNFEDMCNRLDSIPACDGHSDGQTDGLLATA